MFAPEAFVSNWSYVDHMLIPRGAATARERHEGVEEFYYVIAGNGMARVNAEAAPIHAGDAVPILFNDTHSFENTGPADLELMVVGIARLKFALDTQLVK